MTSFILLFLGTPCKDSPVLVFAEFPSFKVAQVHL